MSTLTTLLTELTAGALTVVDLSQPLDPSTPVIELPEPFAQSPGLTIERISQYDDNGPAWYWNTLTLGEHTGTHFDAPVHWITGRDLPNNTTDTIDPARFIGPACVFDVRSEVAENADYLLTVEHLEAWEEEHGRVPAGAWALLLSGWSSRGHDREAFINADEQGPHSPGFHQDTISLLLEKRDILGIGVETVGTDAGQAGTFNPPFPAHNLVHGAGKFGLASLCNLERLPATGAVLIAAPLKITRGSGSPVRVLAIAPS
ncbi:MAG: cyclase family protein [Trueperaceae bacterium]|nr:MAG: cyclase family protein [Trueperaceae bacterium]